MLAGTLEIQMLANTARIKEDMADVKRITGGAMKDIESSVARAKAALGALGVGASVGAFFTMVKNAVQATAALDDMAEATGASVEKLSRLSVVARVHGADMKLVQDGLVRLTRGLKGTDEETQNATAALAALGIQAKTASGQLRDPGEMMQEVAGKLATFRDGAGKTAIALDLFGKSGANLLPYLKDLATAGEYGGRVTAEQAAQAEQLENNLRRMTVAVGEAKRELVIGFTPALVDFTEKLNDAYKAAGNLATALLLVAGGRRSVQDIEADIASTNASIANRWAVTKLTPLGMGAEALDQARLSLLYRKRDYELAQLGRNAAGLEDDLSGTVRGPAAPGVLNYIGRSDTAGAASAARKAAAAAKAAAAKEAKAALDAYDKSLENTARNEDALTQMRVAGVAVEAEAALKRGEALIAGYANVRQIEFETTLIGKSNAEREVAIALRSIETSGIKKTDEAYAGLAKRMEDALAAKALVDKNKKAADEVTEFWKSAAQSMQQSMSGLFFNVMQGNLKGLGNQFASTLQRMVADTLAAKVATGLFGADFGKGGNVGGLLGQAVNWFQSLGGGGGMSSGTFGAAVSGGISYASGTDYVPATGMYKLHQGEAVVPASENRGGERETIVFDMKGSLISREAFEEFRRWAIARDALVERRVAMATQQARVRDA